MEDGVGVIGITNHAQEQLGDVVFVDLLEVGATVEKDETMGAVESVKAASDIYYATINDGVSRALASNPYSSQVVAAIPAWMHSVLGRDFAHFMDAFAGLPGGSTHEGFSSGRVPYELGVYLMEDESVRQRRMGWGE